MKGWRRSAVAMLSVVTLVTFGAVSSSAQTLPGQASPVAVEHTHGPDGLDLDRRGRPGAPAAEYAVDAHADWSQGAYDGKINAADQPDGARDGKAMFHAIYVYPNDKPDYPSTRFVQYAAMFQADARAASTLLSDLYGRAIRFDERDGRMLDITVYKSKYNSKQLSTTRQFNLVNDELATKFNAPNKKYVVWLDAGSQYCGQGHLAQDSTRTSTNQNEGKTLAIVYRPYTASLDDGKTGGFCRGRTLLHELGHTMGALQKGAPHAFDGAHCDDSAEDVMCYTSATSVDTGGPAFDFNNDDYWDPPAGKLAWWTVNLSKFLCDSSSTCDSATTPPQY